MERARTKKKRILHFIGAAFVDGYLWTNALEWNGYYRVDIETGQAEFLGLFEHADVLADKMFFQILPYEKYIFFVPWFSDYLVRLDTTSLDTKYWRVPECIVSEIAKFRAANLYNGQIFMFPHLGDDICIFHIEEERFECDRKWLSEYIAIGLETEKDRFLQGCKKDKFVYLPNLGSSFMMKYDMERYQGEMIVFPKEEGRIIDIIEYEESELLVLTLTGNIWKYNVHSMQKELIYKHGGNNNYPYSHILRIRNILYLIPTNTENIEELGGEKRNKIIYPIGWKLIYIDVSIDDVFVGCLTDEKRFLLYPCKGNMLLKMNVEQKHLSGIEIYESSKDREKAIMKYLETINSMLDIIREPKADLELFLNTFAGQKREKYKEISDTDGMRIWSRMKGN